MGTDVLIWNEFFIYICYSLLETQKYFVWDCKSENYSKVYYFHQHLEFTKPYVT